MKSINFNQNWEFTTESKLDAYNDFGFDKYGDAFGAPERYYDYSNWEHVDLPHDWVVAMPKDFAADPCAGGRHNTHYHRYMSEYHSDASEIENIGWYRKQFPWEEEWAGKRIFLEFDGIYRDAIVWVNGAYMTRHTGGYTGFLLEITDHLIPNTDNSVAVRVDCEHHEGWWYEGGGIYRNVRLHVAEPVYAKPRKTVIQTELDGSVSLSAVLVNDTEMPYEEKAVWKILDADGATVAAETLPVSIPAYEELKISSVLTVKNPFLWHVDHPYLYQMVLSVGQESEVIPFGIRTVAMDTERGFLLNGEPLKIRGACVHQDFGGVGVALSDNLQAYKIQKLKEMGVNAYRAAHHAPASALLRACDELGMLVMDETRMFGTSEEALHQLTELMERDRNHPCVFIWSLGNEEFSIQSEKRSEALMKKASRIAKSLDPSRPVTYGGNNGARFDGINAASEVRGINYIQRSLAWTDSYHQEHPTQPIIGTEESSYVLSRGGAVNDLGSGRLDSTGNVTMSWGTTPKGWVKYFEKRPYLAGSFMWTGFDYRGEPNPFITTCFSSSFGTVDLCGMEKPPFYYYKAWWCDEPVLKLTPHWNHRPGETVTMAVFTNCEEITLSVNGQIKERRRVERFDAPLFTLPFEAGVISVEGTRNGKTYRDELRTSQETATVRCISVLDAHTSSDVGIYQIEAYDQNGNFCPTAAEACDLFIENGTIIGVGNGDPASPDYEQKPKEEEVRYLRTFRYEKGLYAVPTKAPNSLFRRYDEELVYTPSAEGFEDDFRLVNSYQNHTDEKTTWNFVTEFSDAESFEYIEFERLHGKATVYLNGQEIGNNLRCGRVSSHYVRPYRFPCRPRKGENELKIVTEQDTTVHDPISGYVKLGKFVENTPWRVWLHYGLARVFVKSENPKAIRISAKLRK